MIQQIIKNDLEEALQVLTFFLENETSLNHLEQAITRMIQSLKNGKKIISCGNGGSMCDAMHFAEELTGRYRDNRVALPAIALSDPSHISCTANDFGYEYIFSRWIEALGNPGDVLLLFTSSGNSANLIEAAKVAREKGISVIALSGKDGGKLASLCDVEVRVPKTKYADRAQEIHIKLVHIMLNAIEQALFSDEL